jgi:hypothetical protein
VQICCARDCFGGTGGGALGAGTGVLMAGVMVAAVGADVVNSWAFECKQLVDPGKLVFFGQFQAMWP